MVNVVIIDTGCANLSSVKFALERLGYRPTISGDGDVITQADKLILPGVGTAKAAMAQLHERALIDIIKSISQPTLGICLGMQLLTQSSTEGSFHQDDTVKTLGIIDTHTKPLTASGLPLPHMGWNSIEFDDHPLFDGLNTGCHVYFVHSYGVPVGKNTLAKCTYGTEFSAVIGRDNFLGVQFHPEKSGKIGSKILQNFVENI